MQSIWKSNSLTNASRTSVGSSRLSPTQQNRIMPRGHCSLAEEWPHSGQTVATLHATEQISVMLHVSAGSL